MSALWASLLAQADSDDHAALANALLAELLPLLGETTSPVAESEAMLSPAQVASRCGVHVETVRRAIRSGRLPAMKIGARFRIDPDDLGRWTSAPAQPLAAHSVPASRRRRSVRTTGVMAQAIHDLHSTGRAA